MAGKAKGEFNVQKEIEELRARIAALEQDNDSLMEMRRNMAKFFAMDNDVEDDKRQEYKKGEFRSVDAIIRAVERGNVITPQQFQNIDKFSNMLVYSSATWFRNEIISAFSKSYFRINKDHPWDFKFDEIKAYLEDISKMTEKIDVTIYIKNLKPKPQA